jgi:hypothetical protein
VLDCVDGCPDDAEKSDPGVCGCGYPDTDDGGGAICDVLSGSLAHRYDFSGSGTAASDLVGEADGTVNNTTLAGGVLTLQGAEQYVDLPTGVVDGLIDVTFEVWVTWTDSEIWERVFDFGSSDAGAGERGNGTSYIFLTPLSADMEGNPLGLHVGFKARDQDEVFATHSESLPYGVEVVVAIVVDDANDLLTLYLDGQQADQVELPYGLADIDFVNTWIGRSQFVADVDFAGAIDEFRVYSKALSGAEVQYSYEQGADPGYF